MVGLYRYLIGEFRLDVLHRRCSALPILFSRNIVVVKSPFLRPISLKPFFS